ncbi:MAG: aromatic ring-hydroxylating dioxygenase subunit alpha [Aphanocapsa lilacina HA4352-LM1]|nr:aromatic ring-hydroxylating dioxygenase subunit alpha [Aphanocapsa lilacina HA4352-LM1]
MDASQAAPPATLEPTLPGYTYLSDAFYAREREDLFFKEWMCVGREEDLSAAGDFVQLDVQGQSVLIVRSNDGTLRGFYNVCRHRGCALAMDAAAKPFKSDQPGPSGRFAGAIRCPYHGWTYDLEGRLRCAPHLQDSLDQAAFSLYPVGVSLWGGFVFVNLSPAEAQARGYTLAVQLAGEIAYSRRYPLAELRLGRRLVYDVQANWKVIVENYNECYHCAIVHPELCAVVPAFRENGGFGLDWADGVPHKAGASTFTFSGTTDRAPFAGLDEHERTRHKAQLIFPNLLVSLACDHVAAFVLWPQSPGHTRIVCDLLFDPGEMARPGFDPADAAEFWDCINLQDWRVCEGVQRGMGARVFKRGYYAPMEDLAADVRRYIAAKLGEVKP